MSTTEVDEIDWESSDEECEEAMGDDRTSLSSLSSLTVEGKQDIESATLSQLFGTTVTYSFAMRNIQPGKNPLVPVLFINKTKFQICLYDCELDYLILSGIKYFVKNWHLSRSGVVLLWMCVNHRFFLKHIHHPNYYKSTIRSQLAACKKLGEFRKLKELSACWGGGGKQKIFVQYAESDPSEEENAESSDGEKSPQRKRLKSS